MKISPSKIISLLFFIFSGFYLYTAHQIQVFTFDENAAFNAKTFPIYLGYAGLIFSALYIILPETKPSNVDLSILDYKKTIMLVVLMVLYGITILRVGYFLSTSILIIYMFLKALEICLIVPSHDNTEVATGLPACLLPIFIDGIFKAGASTNPDDEFPINAYEYLTRLR